MLIYLARHGESLANVTRTFSNVDAWHPLTPRGRRQARALARMLADQGLSAIYCSPAVRARDTAEIVGRALGHPALVAEPLREFGVGAWEGTNAAEGWAEWAEVMEAWANAEVDRRVGGGESLPEIVDRLGSWLEEIGRRHGAAERVLAIGHGGVFQAALPRLLADDSEGKPLPRFGHCEYVLAELTGGRLRFQDAGARPG